MASLKNFPYMKAVEREQGRLMSLNIHELQLLPEQFYNDVGIDGKVITVEITHKKTSDGMHKYFLSAERKGFLGFGGRCEAGFNLSPDDSRTSFQLPDFEEFK